MSLLFLSKVGLSLWLVVYTLLGGLIILATETAAGHNKLLEEDSQVNIIFFFWGGLFMSVLQYIVKKLEFQQIFTKVLV